MEDRPAPILEFQALSKAFFGVPVLRAVSFAVGLQWTAIWEYCGRLGQPDCRNEPFEVAPDVSSAPGGESGASPD